MDLEKFREVIETIEVSEEIAMQVSILDDEGLIQLANLTFATILLGPEHPQAGLGAMLALMIEAAERRVTREMRG